MHETMLAAKVLTVAAEEAKRRGLNRVQAIRLRLGALWGVEPGSLTFQLSLLTCGTVLADAKWEVETVPIVARCQSCGGEVKDSKWADPSFLHMLGHGPILVEALLHCSRCGQDSVAIEQGRELEILEMGEPVSGSCHCPHIGDSPGSAHQPDEASDPPHQFPSP